MESNGEVVAMVRGLEVETSWKIYSLCAQCTVHTIHRHEPKMHLRGDTLGQPVGLECMNSIK